MDENLENIQMDHAQMHLAQMDGQMDNASEPASLEKLTSDYVNVGLHSLFVLIGLPVNISTLIYILNRYKHAKSFLLLLHINLNITDILVLAVYCSGYVGWLLTYEWMGGHTLCHIMRFVDVFVFSASSNIMVCIALYRLVALRSPLFISAVGHSRVPRGLLLAWTLAAAVAAPQLVVWRQTTVSFPTGNNSLEEATQCVSVWTEKLQQNGQLTEGDMQLMSAYNLAQIMSIFYVPLAILLFCYVLILKDIYSTLNIDDESSSVVYIAEVTRLSSCGKRRSQTKSGEAATVALHPRPVRGQDRFARTKIRSLRITLLLILTYIVTWLPYNLLSWLMMVKFSLYREYEDVLYFLHCLVVLNSVINPFIYGRCQGLKLILSCGEEEDKRKRKLSRGRKKVMRCFV